MGMKIRKILPLGSSRKAVANTPDRAPLAPMTGVMLLGSMTENARPPATPETS